MMLNGYLLVNVFLLFFTKKIYSLLLQDNSMRSPFLANRKVISTYNNTISRPFNLLASIQKPKHKRNATGVVSGVVDIDEYLFEEVDIDINSFLGPEIS